MPDASTVRCKICSKTSIYLCTTDNANGTPAFLEHYRCPWCGLVFVGTDVVEDDISRAYLSFNPDIYYSEIESTNRIRIFSAAADIQREVPHGASILDIGCGNGAFLKSLQHDGYQLYGHEIPGVTHDNDLTDQVIEIYSDFDYSSVPDESFDVVTMLDVAEHVLRPYDLFSACHRVLKPGGLLYFHTPAVTSLDRLMHLVQKVKLIRKAGTLWQKGRTSIFHLQNYTRCSLEIVLDRCGFSTVSFKQKNELSWPIRRYVRVFLRPPPVIAPSLTALTYPLLATNLLNPNKAIVWSRRR